jgi:hypothetical protein
MGKIKTWIKEHKNQLLIGGGFVISVASVALLSKKAITDAVAIDVQKIFQTGVDRGIDKICRVLDDGGHQDILSDMLERDIIRRA